MPELQPTDADRVAKLEQQFADLTQRLNSINQFAIDTDTQVDAQEQAIAAMQAAQRNRKLLSDLHRKVNTLVCLFAAAVQVYAGNQFALDSTSVNDRWGEWLLMSGLLCTALGLVALFGKEDKLIDAIAALNPWSRRHD